MDRYCCQLATHIYEIENKALREMIRENTAAPLKQSYRQLETLQKRVTDLTTELMSTKIALRRANKERAIALRLKGSEKGQLEGKP